MKMQMAAKVEALEPGITSGIVVYLFTDSPAVSFLGKNIFHRCRGFIERFRQLDKF